MYLIIGNGTGTWKDVEAFGLWCPTVNYTLDYIRSKNQITAPKGSDSGSNSFAIALKISIFTI
jgi:hypothetical protein